MIATLSLAARLDPDRVSTILREVADEAILPRFRRLADGDVRLKSDGSQLTEADEESERLLTQRLADLLPGSLVVGEEAVAAQPDVLKRLNGQGTIWIVDPIDGTRQFAAGDDRFGILVSLVQDRELVASWIYLPVHGQMAMAVLSGGTMLDGQRVRLKGGVDLDSLKGGYNVRWLVPEAQQSALKAIIRQPGMAPDTCSAWDYCCLLRGEANIYMGTHTTPWDTPSGVLACREAGGWSGPIDDSPYHPSAVAGAILHAPSPEDWKRMRDYLFPTVRGPSRPLLTPDGQLSPRPPKLSLPEA